MPSARILRPDHAPTPFSADQIRDASPDGWTVETRTSIGGVVTERERTVFRDPDDATVLLEKQPLDAAGEPAGAAVSRRVAWLDLQRHASFPADETTITPERIVHPLGELDCLRYEVRRPHGVDVFWFWPSRPGMPVAFSVGPPAAREVTEVVEAHG